MNRQHKILILILATVFVFSLCVVGASADEIDINDYGKQPTQLIILPGNNSKTEYTEGELFDPTGFRGYVSCYNPLYSFYIESSALTYIETSPLTPNITDITFVYEGLIYKSPITVNAAPETTETPTEPEQPEQPEQPTVQVVGFEATASKTEFLALEKIDPSIFTIELVNSDGTRTAVDTASCSFHPSLEEPVSAYVKAYTVTYSVGDVTYSDIIQISVSPVLLVSFEGLESAYLYEGMTPSIPHGLKATVHYNGAQTISQTVTDYDIEYPSDTVTADANGKTVITLVFDSKRVNVEVMVSPIVNYKATGFKTAYYYGDTFSYANAQITAIYGDGTTRDVTSEVQFTAPEIITANCKITAVHNGYDLTSHLGFTLPQGTLTVVTPPAKLHYEIGESFDATGLTVAIEYTDGVRSMLAPTDYTVSAPAVLASTDKAATVTYFGTTTSIEIKVGHEAYITSIQLIGSPDVRSYYEGYLLNTAGLIIEAYYSDGTKTILDHASLTFTPSLTTPLTVDMTEVKISVGEGDKLRVVSYPITVQDKYPTALVPISFPSKRQYIEGEKFNPDGLELRLYFNDGTFVVPSTYNFSPELGSTIILHSNASEKYIIDAIYAYEGETYTYPIEITVTPAEVENLLITRTPVKTVYEIGEQFDPAGLEIIIIYKDRSLAMTAIPDGYYTYAPSTITEATTEILFSFRGFSVSLPITVNGAETTDVTTEPIDPPVTDPNPPETTLPPEVTTGPDVTTEAPETTEDPDVTTEAPEITEDPETTMAPEITEDPNVTTEAPEITTDPNSGGEDGPSSLLYIWIVVIVIIVAALVALIIYYKKNFT